MKLCWVTIKVNNMDESLKFYQDVIGLNLNFRQAIGGKDELAFLGEGDAPVELVYSEGITPDIGKDVSIAFKIDSVEDWLIKLNNLDIEIYAGPFQPSPSSKFFFILDPNGVQVQLVEGL